MKLEYTEKYRGKLFSLLISFIHKIGICVQKYPVTFGKCESDHKMVCVFYVLNLLTKYILSIYIYI